MNLRHPRIFLSALALSAATACLIPARGEEDYLDIGVRTSVPDKTTLWSHDKNKIPGEGGHGRTFGILSVSPIPSENKLNQPVDAQALLGHLLHELDANGFKPMVKGQKPDILLTVSYGRAELNNPYIRDTGEVSFQVDSVHTQTITGAFSQQLIDEKTPGYEAKLQKAGFEKLFIRVTAWEYPTDPKAKPKMLWKTVVVADDPDHRDLNAIAQRMLAAAAPFFDKEIKEKEVDIYQKLPEGHVQVGTPEVVGADVKKTK